MHNSSNRQRSLWWDLWAPRKDCTYSSQRLKLPGKAMEDIHLVRIHQSQNSEWLEFEGVRGIMNWEWSDMKYSDLAKPKFIRTQKHNHFQLLSEDWNYWNLCSFTVFLRFRKESYQNNYRVCRRNTSVKFRLCKHSTLQWQCLFWCVFSLTVVTHLTSVFVLEETSYTPG